MLGLSGWGFELSHAQCSCQGQIDWCDQTLIGSVDESMASLVPTSLFSSIDLDLAKQITKELLQEHYRGKAMEAQTIYELLKMCLYTCFSLNGNVREPIHRFIAEASRHDDVIIIVPMNRALLTNLSAI